MSHSEHDEMKSLLARMTADGSAPKKQEDWFDCGFPGAVTATQAQRYLLRSLLKDDWPDKLIPSDERLMMNLCGVTVQQWVRSLTKRRASVIIGILKNDMKVTDPEVADVIRREHQEIYLRDTADDKVCPECKRRKVEIEFRPVTVTEMSGWLFCGNCRRHWRMPERMSHG